MQRRGLDHAAESLILSEWTAHVGVQVCSGTMGNLKLNVVRRDISNHFGAVAVEVPPSALTSLPHYELLNKIYRYTQCA